MRYLALACSYDETIAVDGRIDQATEAGLRRLVASGRQLVLLSRRPLDELLATLPEHLFVWIVAEYGGLLHHPGTRMGRPLADPIPHAVVQGLRDREVTPLAVGQVSVATSQANQAAVQEVVQEAGVELEVVADKDQVLAVPAGVDKATGLDAALQELELSAHNLVGVGHAAIDQGFLGRCAVAVAVANAAEGLKQRCDLVTKRPAGAGVVELVDRLVTEDLADLDTQLGRYRLLLGHDQDRPVTVPAYGANLLLAGPSGTGKSTLAAGLLERLAEQDYQVLVLDPEGDHEDFQNAVHLGDRHDPPGIDQLLAALQEPGQRVVANLLGRRLEELPGYLNQFLRRLPELRTRTGRPHFLMLEEAHHFLPLPGERGAFVLPRWVDGLIMATVNPEHVSPRRCGWPTPWSPSGTRPPPAWSATARPLVSRHPKERPRSSRPGRRLPSAAPAAGTWCGSRSPAGQASAGPICAAGPRANWMLPTASISAAPRGGYGSGRPPSSSSCCSPRASTRTPGSITCARVTTRPGSAPPPTTRSWPSTPPRSNRATCRPTRAASASSR